jgi:glyoxylase-like metal-dependent hydrolase (beta-lactamase superfamily II)
MDGWISSAALPYARKATCPLFSPPLDPSQEIVMATTAQLTRRNVLSTGAAAGAGAALGLAAGPAAAKAPMATTQGLAFYRFMLGGMQATVISDGPLPLGKPSDTLKGVPEAELTKSLSDSFLLPDRLVLEQNVLVLNTGSRVVMFDSGMGFSKAFGADTGRLIPALWAAGIKPDQIDDVICTHAHIDHVGGIASRRGQRLFANATIHLSQIDHDFWTDETKLSDKNIGAFVKHARDNLLPYKGRIKFVADGREVVPGVQAMATPGHTAGHMIYLIDGGSGARLAFIGDVAHHHLLLTERPRIEFLYDMDAKQAVTTRLRVFDMLSKDRTPMLAFHFPWPGYGHLARAGADSFRYIPAPLSVLPATPKPGVAKKV